jgi:hypothetical protein
MMASSDVPAAALRGREQAVRALQAEETEPGVWQARLGEDLAESSRSTEAGAR